MSLLRIVRNLLDWKGTTWLTLVKRRRGPRGLAGAQGEAVEAGLVAARGGRSIATIRHEGIDGLQRLPGVGIIVAMRVL
jgi:hypothetical protein